MFDELLGFFTAPGHPLTLVYDPDELLADEEILAALSSRGYLLVRERDPFELRHRLANTQHERTSPLIIASGEELNQLPYDLWQQGHHVILSLTQFYPKYSAPVVRALTTDQRWQLSQVPQPARKLGRQATIAYILLHVFKADLISLSQPAQLIGWLNLLHQQPESLPPILLDFLLARLQPLTQYQAWPLEAIIRERASFKQFVDEQWRAYLQQETGEKLLGEAAVAYVLPFAHDQQLQDTISALVRHHILDRISVAGIEKLDPWAVAAVQIVEEDPIPRRLDEALMALSESAYNLDGARWPQWQSIASIWAEINNLRYDPDAKLPKYLLDGFNTWREKLDIAFLAWLRSRYSALAVQKLPTPHHLYHVPGAIDHGWSRQHGIALLVMDGLSLSNWQIIRERWRGQHPHWQLEEQLLLAQIPTVTSVSRQALVSGQRPMDFAATIGQTSEEPRLWRAFWERKELAARSCYFGRLQLENDTPPELTDPRHHMICLIVNDIDEYMVHRAGLGMTDSFASLQVWLQERSEKLAAVIDELLQRHFTVYVASDHGHTEATGAGQPMESSLLVETRSRRARLYSDPLLAESIHAGYPQTMLWRNDGLLPDDMVALLADGRTAFATENKKIVTHGGMTLDEVIVPFVKINQR